MSDPSRRAKQHRNCDIEYLSDLAADAAKAAKMLCELYGDRALERAQLL